MLVTWLGHAQLFINTAEKTLLLDPWFFEPVFGGAWFRYPPAPYANASTLPKPDFLLLSHIHPDHSGPKTLEQLPRGTPTFALPFKSGALARRLKRCGYTNVNWLEPYETREVAPGVKITFVPHDRGWEVSSIVVEADGVRLYHGNDNPLSVAAYEEIVSRLGKIDLAFLPYAGASSYPTGFAGDDATLKSRCEQKKAEGIKRFVEGLEGLRPGEAVPFASSWALLEPGELWKNFIDRPTADETLKAAMPVAAKFDTHLLHLEPGDEWSPDTGVLSKGLCAGWSNDPQSVERYAKQEAARVEQAIKDWRASSGFGVSAGGHAKLDQAFVEYFEAITEGTLESTRELKMNAGFEATGALSWSVRFNPGQKPTVERGLKGDEDEVLSLPSEELWALLVGPANWEDVWYGYRLQVRKRAGAGYYRAFWEMLLNFDADALSERLKQKYAPTAR